MMEAMARVDHPTYAGVLLKNEPMAKHTSWRVGGPAKWFFKPVDLNDIAVFLQTQKYHEPLLWLGLGSNLLVRDGGFNGTVILTTPTLKSMHLGVSNRVQVQAGVACAKLARFAAAHD